MNLIGLDMAAKPDRCAVTLKVHAQVLGVMGLSLIEAQRSLDLRIIEMDTEDLGKGNWRIILAEPLGADMWHLLTVRENEENYSWQF